MGQYSILYFQIKHNLKIYRSRSLHFFFWSIFKALSAVFIVRDKVKKRGGLAESSKQRGHSAWSIAHSVNNSKLKAQSKEGKSAK
jgi:hypothetical protein